MAGGFKNFGPTYKTTDIIRLGYEGYLNGAHPVSAKLVKEAAANDANEPNMALAGKIAAMKEDGVGLAGEGGAGAIGLFREDLNDMVNASLNASFYFRGGEYYVQASRTAIDLESAKVGNKLTTNENGELKVSESGDDTIVGVITHIGGYTAGNMYEWAGDAANGGSYIGFIMYI